MKLVMVDQGQLLPSAATAPCFNLRAHILSLKPYYQENFEFNESIFFSNLLQVAELNHGSGEPPRGLFRTSKYRQPLHPNLHAHTCTQARTHTHVHTLFVTIFPPVLTWMGIYNCIEKVTSSASEIPHFTELLLWHTCQAAKCYVSPIIDLQQHL